MSSQSHKTKRAHSAISPDDGSPTRSPQRKRRPTSKLLQGTLAFVPLQLSQVLTARKSPSLPTAAPLASFTRGPALSPTPSEPSSPLRPPALQKLITILASKRIFFEVDFDFVGTEFRLRKRTKRSINYSRITWIYLHGIELEKKDPKRNEWTKYWICRPCYDAGSRCKVMAAESTASCGKHLIWAHGIYALGTHPPVASGSKLAIRSCFEGAHPLHAERWRQDFINWIAHDDITFEQAASPRLNKIILSGSPAVQHLLTCSRTVRSWLMKTCNERIADVKSSLACS
jgi:hypothetical protein